MKASKFIAGLVIGAAAGAAITLLLQTEKGKKMVADIKDFSDNLSNDSKEKYEAFENTIAEVVEKGKAFINNASNSTSNPTV